MSGDGTIEKRETLTQEETIAFWEEGYDAEDPDSVEVNPVLLKAYALHEESMAAANKLDIEIEEEVETFTITADGEIFQANDTTNKEESKIEVEGGMISYTEIKKDPILEMVSERLWNSAISEMVEEYRGVTHKIDMQLDDSAFVDSILDDDLGALFVKKKNQIITGFQGPEKCPDWVKEEAMERIRKKLLVLFA